MSQRMTKPTKWHVHPVKTQISLGICPVWSESSLSAWRKLVSLATNWVHSKDSDQDWADAQADLSLRWAHMQFWGFVVCWFILRKWTLWHVQNNLPTKDDGCSVDSQVSKNFFRWKEKNDQTTWIGRLIWVFKTCNITSESLTLLAAEKIDPINNVIAPVQALLPPENYTHFPNFSMKTYVVDGEQKCHGVFVWVEVLWPSQPIRVMSSVVSLPNHTFQGQA